MCFKLHQVMLNWVHTCQLGVMHQALSTRVSTLVPKRVSMRFNVHQALSAQISAQVSTRVWIQHGFQFEREERDASACMRWHQASALALVGFSLHSE